MSNSINAAQLPVAAKGQKVATPATVTGKILSVDMISVGDKSIPEELREKAFSITIEGMPTIETKSGRKATILRNAAQMRRDLKYFAPSINSNKLLLNAADLYTVGRNVTLEVSAHEVGALVPVTEFTSEEVRGDKQIGEYYESNSSGFYVDGFLSVDFAREDKLRMYEKAEAAAQLATQATQ